MNGALLSVPYSQLHWWSVAALDGLSRRIAPLWLAWATRWDLPAGSVEAFNAHEAPPEDALAWQPWQADACAVTPWAWVAAGTDTPVSAIVRLAFGSGEALSIAAEVAGRAWHEFGDEVARLLGRAPSSALPPFGHPRSAAWSGSVRVRLRWARRDAPDLWLHFTADSMTPVLRETQRRWSGHVPPVSVSALDTIAHQPITLRAELGATELDLGTLQSLRVGDVLTLSHRLDAPLTLRTADAQATVACAGYLGARHGRRAIEVVRPHDA